jgi:hypothetical protein
MGASAKTSVSILYATGHFSSNIFDKTVRLFCFAFIDRDLARELTETLQLDSLRRMFASERPATFLGHARFVFAHDLMRKVSRSIAARTAR